MSVKRKMQVNGKMSRYYYYEFNFNGKRYRGSTGKETEAEAKAFESQRKNEIRMLEKSSISDKATERSLLNFREKVTDQIKGESISLNEVWQTFRKEAPSVMKQPPGEKMWKAKKRFWMDFLYFTEKHKDGLKTLRDVKPSHAREYVGHLKTNGKFYKNIQCHGKIYKNKIKQLSASTINAYITHIKQIFSVLKESGGLVENPFDCIPKLICKDKPREVFESHELKKIYFFLTEEKGVLPHASNPVLDLIINEAIFFIGFNTGLRRSDISLLKWEHINFQKKAISKVLEKTKETVFIPMTRFLYNFLWEKSHRKRGEHVTPELAEMYLNNSCGISYRFKKMLEHLKIKSLKSYDGRSRRTSVKDIHSLRHTFCYLHGVQGTPLVTVQSMVGHMDKRMTEAYMMHQTEELKRDAIEKYALGNLLPDASDDIKELAIRLIRDCEESEKIHQVVSNLQNSPYLS